MSVSVDAQGRVLVLDQVNGRIMKRGRDGKTEATMPLKQLGAQDIASAADGSLVVMDRLVDKSLALYGPTGAPVGELPLSAEAVGDPGLLTGVFVDGSDVYVEREHGMLVRVGDTAGNPAGGNVELPGRPSRDGALLISAGIIDSFSGRAFVSAIDRATMQHRFTRELRFAGVLRSIGLLDSDRKGTIYLAVTLARGDAEAVVLSCLDPAEGAPAGSNELPPSSTADETFRDFAVLDEGGVLYAHRTADGASYERYDCR